MDHVQNLIATLKNTAIGVNLHCGHTLCMDCMKGIIKSGSNMCPYKCLPPIAPMSKEQGVPLAAGYYGDLQAAADAQDDDMSRGLRDGDFTAAQARIDELAASNNPADRALAATRQEAVDRVARARQEVDDKEAAQPWWEDDEAEEDDEDQDSYRQANEVTRQLFDFAKSWPTWMSLEDSPLNLAMLHVLGSLYLCKRMQSISGAIGAPFEYLAGNRCDNWRMLYNAQESAVRFKTLPWGNARDVVYQFESRGYLHSKIISLANAAIASWARFGSGIRLKPAIYEVVTAWKTMARLIMAHCVCDQEDQIVLDSVKPAIECINTFYRPSRSLRAEFEILSVDGWRVLRKYDWTRDWLRPDCHEVYRNPPDETDGPGVLSSVTPPRPEQADDFHRWYLEVLDRAGIDPDEYSDGEHLYEESSDSGEGSRASSDSGQDLRAQEQSAAGPGPILLQADAPILQRRRPRATVTPYWWPDSPAATAEDQMLVNRTGGAEHSGHGGSTPSSAVWAAGLVLATLMMSLAGGARGP
jgi:hypothetical protein